MNTDTQIAESDAFAFYKFDGGGEKRGWDGVDKR